MPEFSEVMAQINRMCRTMNCDDCPLSEMGCCGNIGGHCSEPLQVERIEKTVMAWAAENPEPVYPTWIEWLVDKGLIIKTADNYGFNFTRAANTIPADIAEKLGLEPQRID